MGIMQYNNETTTTHRDGHFKDRRKATRTIKLIQDRFSCFGRRLVHDR